jgi:hypothetical protein
MDGPAEIVVRGVVRFASDVQAFTGATLHVRLERSGPADAAARVAAHVAHVGVGYTGRPLPFELRTAEVRAGAPCRLRVHVDVDGDGTVSAGDFVSTESVTVAGSAEGLEIRVARV